MTTSTIVLVIYRSKTAFGAVVGQVDPETFLVRVGGGEYMLPKSRLAPLSLAGELIEEGVLILPVATDPMVL
jgi:hypothetical protein